MFLLNFLCNLIMDLKIAKKRKHELLIFTSFIVGTVSVDTNENNDFFV